MLLHTLRKGTNNYCNQFQSRHVKVINYLLLFARRLI